MKGYLFNALLVVGGSLLGLLVGRKIHDNVKDAVFNVLGLVTAFVGIKMALNGSDIIPIVFALVIGSFIGSALKLEDRVHGALNSLNDSYLSGKYDIEGFLVASTLFCVGSMTIVGSLKDGLYNDSTLIKTKSVLDGFASFVLASRLGPSVAFSAITIIVIQGILTYSSAFLTMLTSQWMMNNIDGVGGIIILAIGLNLLKLKTIKTIDMLPSLLLVVLYGLWVG
jgi:uncharacterized membrane protein YqgA involved in biofilm formation